METNKQESSYFYSPSENAFFPIALKDAYDAANTWPQDCNAISDELYAEYTATPPAGKIRGCGSNGQPIWVDYVSQIDPTEYASSKKTRLLTLATNAIAPLQDAVNLGMANESEIAVLKEWQIFRVLVNRVDPADGESIVWPTEPSSQN